MIYKACIMKIEDDFAIVLSDDMQYRKIIKKDGMNIGNNIIFVEEDIYREKKINYKRISALAAVVFVLFMSINIFNIKNNKNIATVAVVSLDINPSIEFELNKKGVVLKVNNINEEANKIIDEKAVGKRIEDALYITINNAKEKNYLSVQKNSVLISAVILDSSMKNKLKVETDLQTKLNEDESDNYINIVYLESNKNNMKNAHKNDMSIGKYEAFKEIKKQNTNVSIYEVKNMKVNQIFDKSGNIYSDITKVDKQDKSIKDKIDNSNIESEEKINKINNFENKLEEIDYLEELQDNQGTQKIIQTYDKNQNKNKEDKEDKEEKYKYKKNKEDKEKYKKEKEDRNEDKKKDNYKFKDKIKNDYSKKDKSNKNNYKPKKNKNNHNFKNKE
ncbi:anti-sigma factor domain-containing protein [Tepidibacter mesophilus]|uniref:anti-sigma factor domain-containing protein n=1 Tax=Tepidibacter mesophilus TaxID=655607 RepID=UPI000C06AF2E|nr:anti-sigma factor domain-containing protein [Tepidibacter mesophilus]